MKIFRPDSKGFVRNIQTDSDKGKQMAQPGVSAGKKSIYDKDLIFWIPSGKVLEINKNNQGLTTGIRIASGAAFTSVNYSGSMTYKAKKQGLSKVSHYLHLNLEPGDDLLSKAEDFLATNIKLSVLHVDKFGDGFLYGENQGLAINEIKDSQIVLEGTEDNVFYEISHDCLQKILPKTE